MEPAGHDTILFSFGDPFPLALEIQQRYHTRWPKLLVDVDLADFTIQHHSKRSVEPYASAINDDRLAIVTFYRDSEMQAYFREYSYQSDDTGEGGVSVWFRQRPNVIFSLNEVDEIQHEDSSPPFPYPAMICARELLEVTVVTPNDLEPGNFSFWAVQEVMAACADIPSPA